MKFWKWKWNNEKYYISEWDYISVMCCIIILFSFSARHLNMIHTFSSLNRCTNAFQHISTSTLCKSSSDCDFSFICCAVKTLGQSICVPFDPSELVVLQYDERTSERSPRLPLPIPRPIPVPRLAVSPSSYVYNPNASYKWWCITNCFSQT